MWWVLQRLHQGESVCVHVCVCVCVCVFTEKEKEWEWGERGCFLIPRGDVSDELED